MVESTALEMRRAGNGTVGSNPTLSATSHIEHCAIHLDGRTFPNKRSENRVALKVNGRQPLIIGLAASKDRRRSIRAANISDRRIIREKGG